MTRAIRVSLIAAGCLLSGCASYDRQDQYVLGAATRANIAAQAVRDVNLPNSREVAASSGVRAAKAVQALNDGKTKTLADAGGTGGGE
ncbi:putative lipoprotein [Hyphomonas neptunium ATCC 15444]|uniref:Putative lipoprotein n=1 Tax=Hyphomonas neptunium (strain ATCC 15444) TaxID=228405 RepID=Q0C323_HYPNA|nr:MULTISPECIES: hypothetical protein [Hyphomonas]ABI76898.1 putative lipoprotein [Hyphomonas neptunium ATCC 15444]